MQLTLCVCVLDHATYFEPALCLQPDLDMDAKNDSPGSRVMSA